MAPFGFIDDGLGDDTFIDGEGNLWEYGSSEVDVEYMWNYQGDCKTPKGFILLTFRKF